MSNQDKTVKSETITETTPSPAAPEAKGKPAQKAQEAQTQTGLKKAPASIFGKGGKDDGKANPTRVAMICGNVDKFSTTCGEAQTVMEKRMEGTRALVHAIRMTTRLESKDDVRKCLKHLNKTIVENGNGAFSWECVFGFLDDVAKGSELVLVQSLINLATQFAKLEDKSQIGLFCDVTRTVSMVQNKLAAEAIEAFYAR